MPLKEPACDKHPSRRSDDGFDVRSASLQEPSQITLVGGVLERTPSHPDGPA